MKKEASGLQQNAVKKDDWYKGICTEVEAKHHELSMKRYFENKKAEEKLKGAK